MRRPMWFNRDGEPITVEEWGELRESDSEYFRVAEDNLEAVSFDGEWYSMLWVSTVWLGINHNYGDGPPLIFETMVFVQEDMGGEIGCMRYATDIEALEGHRATVACLQASQRPFAWAEIGDRS